MANGIDLRMPMWVALTHVRCSKETKDVSDSDEIYMIYAVASLAGPVPAFTLEHTKVYEFDAGQQRAIHHTLWPVDGVADAANEFLAPNNVIILLALMEHDASNPGQIVTAVRPQVFGNLISYTSVGLGRNIIASRLATDMANSIRFFAVATSFGSLPGSADDLIGLQNISIAAQETARAAFAGEVMRHSVSFSGDGGKYWALLQIGRAGANPTAPNLAKNLQW